MIREVTMYRVVCDYPECEKSPQDDGEFYAWAQAHAAADEASEAGWRRGTGADEWYCETGHPVVWASDLEGETGGAWDTGAVVDMAFPIVLLDDISPNDDGLARVVTTMEQLPIVLDGLANTGVSA